MSNEKLIRSGMCGKGKTLHLTLVFAQLKIKKMNINNLQDLKYDTTRQIVLTTRGEELPIKEHRGWKYVNFNGIKIGVTKIPILYVSTPDPVFDYVFGGGFQTHPCHAMDYWIYRHRMGNKISTNQYKIKHNIH